MVDQPKETMAVLDVWGKEDSQEHMARYYVPLADALQLAALDLQASYSVTIRVTSDLSEEKNFDKRLCTIH